MRTVGTASLATFLISLINHAFESHVYSLAIYFIANAIFLFLQCSASCTHSLSLSLCCLALFPLLSISWHTLSDHINKLSRFTSLSFHLEVCTQLHFTLTYCNKFLLLQVCFQHCVSLE
jgi:hypothetical protein